MCYFGGTPRINPVCGACQTLNSTAMGLTIHYSLHSTARSIDEARKLVEQLRQRALDLPFKRVGDIVDFTGDECDYDKRPPPRDRCGSNPLLEYVVHVSLPF